MMDINRLIENFKSLDQWEDRYKLIIELGRQTSAFTDAEKKDDYIVKGCMSKVWLIPDSKSLPYFEFRADSDAAIVKGLIHILQICLSKKTVTEILDFEIDPIFEELGLSQHLSPGRRNGFYSMLKQIKLYALVLSQHSKKHS